MTNKHADTHVETVRGREADALHVGTRFKISRKLTGAFYSIANILIYYYSTILTIIIFYLNKNINTAFNALPPF